MKPEKSRQLLKYASKLGINVSWGESGGSQEGI
jgi:hypothetical protein